MRWPTWRRRGESVSAAVRQARVGYGLLPLVAVAIVGCEEALTAPGACPDFCPSVVLEVRDTVIEGSLERDEWVRGYFQPYQAAALRIASPAAGIESRGIIRFTAFGEEFNEGGELRPIVSLDSFRVDLGLLRQFAGVDSLEFAIHRLPIDVDTTTTFLAVDPLFDDSTLIGTLVVPDSVESGTVSLVLPGDAFPTFAADSQRAAIGLAVRGAAPAWADVRSREGVASAIVPASLVRFVTIDSADGETAERLDTRQVGFDTFVAPDLAPPAPDVLAVGGLPSARAFLRVNLPLGIMDSSEVVRATLLLVPSEPVIGSMGDTVKLRALGLQADVGPKSPFFLAPADSVGAADVLVGATDTIEVDITYLVRPWQGDSTLARALLLTVTPEAGSLGEIRLRSTRSLQGAPAMRVTYVPLFFEASP
jgi:hypothetical protein